MDTYEIYLGQDAVGTVRVMQEGLYYRFLCRCELSGDVVYRVMVSCGTHQENLGVLVPMNGVFYIDKKVPLKHLGKGKLEFRLLPKHPELEHFVPLGPEEPFSYISRLKNAYLLKKDGQRFIGFRPST
jgi:hypothetical protein